MSKNQYLIYLDRFLKSVYFSIGLICMVYSLTDNSLKENYIYMYTVMSNYS